MSDTQGTPDATTASGRARDALIGQADDDRTFRARVRAFIAAEYPSQLSYDHPEGYDLSKEDLLLWHRILARKGWIAPAWPVEYGGAGWSAIQQSIWLDELAGADTVPIVPLGISMVGPVIYTFGTEAQKTRFLPPTLSGDIWWCQGFSEPGAGSDLASLRTRAVRESDHYVVDGQKTWATMAQYADWGFFLVRTAETGKSQQGISFLLIDMKSPGVTVRPIKLIDGTCEVNEIWLEGVRVPIEQRIGEENAGWTYAKFLLTHERTGFAEVARSKRALHKLRPLVLANGNSPRLRRKLIEIDVELAALEATERRLIAFDAGQAEAGPIANLLKIRGSELQQRIAELRLQIEGPHSGMAGEGSDGRAQASSGSAAANYLNMRKTPIYGGTNEIQRNIIAKTLLRG